MGHQVFHLRFFPNCLPGLAAKAQHLCKGGTIVRNRIVKLHGVTVLGFRDLIFLLHKGDVCQALDIICAFGLQPDRFRHFDLGRRQPRFQGCQNRQPLQYRADTARTGRNITVQNHSSGIVQCSDGFQS